HTMATPAHPVIRGKTMAKLIDLLSSTPGQELHTRELVRRVDGTERPVQLALERLERQGVVQSRRFGNLRLWRMDKGNPLYRSLRELSSRTIGVGAELRSAFARETDVELAFIFGSYARGDDDVTSDIYLFVLGQPNWQSLGETTQRLNRRLGREVNAVVWTTIELKKAIQSGSAFWSSLMAEPKLWLIGSEVDLEQRVRRLESEVRGRAPRRESRSTRRAGQGQARRTKPGSGTTKPRSGRQR